MSATEKLSEERAVGEGPTEPPTPEREQRIRTLSPKATEIYAEKVEKHQTLIRSHWQEVFEHMNNIDSCEETVDSFNDAKRKLCLVYSKYRIAVREFFAYLHANYTVDSIHLLSTYTREDEKCSEMVESILKQLEAKTEALTENLSRHSNRSSRRSSHVSCSSSEALRARAKADKARATREFILKEAMLRKQQAELVEQETVSQAKSQRKRQELEVDLDILKEERICAEAEAEAEAYQDFQTVDECGLSQKSAVLPNVVENPYDRTQAYVSSHMRPPSRDGYTSREPMVNEECRPQNGYAVLPQSNNTDTVFNNFTNYLIKKELISSRFMKFTEDPATYGVWKSSFKSVIAELDVSPQEELALLTNWLGPESSKQAVSMRAANAHNPAQGLQKIWARLEERYGAPELVENMLRKKINEFPRISQKDTKRLYDLGDILSEIESVKEDERYRALLSFYDTSSGVNPIVAKLPFGLQNKWINRASKYKGSHQVTFPPFSFFVKFIREMSTTMNDPSFAIENQKFQRENVKAPARTSGPIMVKKTDVYSGGVEKNSKTCIIHSSGTHSLNECRDFRRRPISERKQLLKEHRICFKCCDTDAHMAKSCNTSIKCRECNSKKHPTGLHQPLESQGKESSHSEEKPHGGEQVHGITTRCTTVCGEGISGRSCAKTLLVDVFPDGQPEKVTRVYAVLDDQSNRTLASSELLDCLGVSGKDICYTISSCSGTFQASGRKTDRLVVRSIDGSSSHKLPTTIECNDIPQDSSEAATPEVVLQHSHLKELSDHIPPYRSDCQVGLLIGRDLPEAHHVHNQIVGPRQAPFAQKLSLGWVVIGEVCLGRVHPPSYVKVMKTAVINGRGSIFQPCNYNLYTKERENDPIFVRTKDDEKISLSVEDRHFLEVMRNECHKDEDGFWMAPLPFRYPKPRMPNNRQMAWKRAMILDASLKKNPTKREHFISFMQKVLDSRAAEVAPHATDEVWYLPIFGVYHPKKPEKIRGVFDSSAVFEGISLNGTLISGPNLTNSLLSILLRFRNDSYAVTADVEQMFYRFLVKEEHRDFLRFLWYRNNDPTQDLIEYRMRAHVFGNSPSPAVATFALRKTVEDAEDDVKSLVNKDFYVDDCLVSRPTVQQATSVVKRTQSVLKENGNIRLHKITSNSSEVMNAFPEEDRCQGLKYLNFEEDLLPIQHSLGMSWDLSTDRFKFDVHTDEKSGTRRGMLSTLNSIFDPIGFISPITIHGRILFRELTTGIGWDEHIPDEHLRKWNDWTLSLEQLKNISIPRMFVPLSLTTSDNVELHIYSDASEKAIAAAAYVKTLNGRETHTGFVMGKAKLAPAKGHTIPRLELCAAVMAIELAETLSESLNIPLQLVKYYSDSRVVLGYINNKTRRFYTYVANRVERILRSCQSDQWSYVPTNENPADQATRTSMTVDKLDLSMWLTGPRRLQREKITGSSDSSHPLVDPDVDQEVRPEVISITSKKTSVRPNLHEKFERFSSWQKLTNAISFLKRFIRNQVTDQKMVVDNVTARTETQQFIIKQSQKFMFTEEVTCLENGEPVGNSSSISSLNPYLDGYGIMRVGGRLNKGELSLEETNPVILHSRDHVSKLIVLHYHESVHHQGRHITEGALRNNGFWIVGAKRLVSSIIHHCVTCRKLRGKLEHQQMADLPIDRIQAGPLFTSVGVDVFGPWSVITRKTRGGSANSKRWAALFTCLSSRAIHIEVLEEMSSSSFINALRRFVAIRGNVKEFRSDCGTNFVGATDHLHIDSINVTDGPVSKYLYNSGVVWKFNAPHSSHMGGVWERMIGLVRNVLNSMLLGAAGKCVTHEVLVTFMAEVCAIINSRPVGPISTDPESPEILSPAVLLNQKIGQSDQFSQVSFCEKDLYKEHWRRVQILSSIFWKKWREGYLQSLQCRRKWKLERPNVEVGDVILLKDKNLPRNDWSLGIVLNAIGSKSDGKVRKAEVRVMRNGKPTVLSRPITEMVILVENKQHSN